MSDKPTSGFEVSMIIEEERRQRFLKHFALLEAVAEAAETWLNADDAWEIQMPDDWVMSRDGYRAREVLREKFKALREQETVK